jgi:hypothetical protein
LSARRRGAGAGAGVITVRDYQLIYPMFALVLLTMVVLVTLFRRRVRAVSEGHVSMGYFAIHRGAVEPEASVQAARHFSNLFEAPTLFYAGCLAAMVTHDTGLAVQVLAWIYVAARVLHAIIHLGSNRIGQRVRAYGIGWLALVALWIQVVAHVALNT